MERYRHLVDTSPDGILIVDDDRIAFANRAAVALFGADDAAQVLGRSIVDCFDADSRDSLNDRLQHARIGGVAPFEARIARSDGPPLDVSVTAAPLPLEGDRALQVIVREITAQQQA